MPDVVPEFLPAAEPLEVKLKDFLGLLQGRFAGQLPVLNEVNRAIQPTIEPELSSLPTIDELLGEYVNAADWQQMPYNWGFASSGEPAGEHPEWEKDWLYLDMPPGAKEGNSWAKMIVHRGTVHDGKFIHTEPWIMLSYFPRGKAEEGLQAKPARMEIVHFSRWDKGGELASVTQVYEEKGPVATASAQ